MKVIKKSLALLLAVLLLTGVVLPLQGIVGFAEEPEITRLAIRANSMYPQEDEYHWTRGDIRTVRAVAFAGQSELSDPPTVQWTLSGDIAAGTCIETGEIPGEAVVHIDTQEALCAIGLTATFTSNPEVSATVYLNIANDSPFSANIGNVVVSVTNNWLLSYTTPAGYNDNDYQKLVAFALQGDNQAKLTWNLTAPVAWKGITWEYKGGEYRVTKVNVTTTFSATDDLTGALDVSNFLYLDDLQCANNAITDLNTSGCPALTYLDCDRNKIAALNLVSSVELTNLHCSWNALTALDLTTNTKLSGIRSIGNKLGTLNIAECVNLLTLDCSLNQITALDFSKTTKLTAVNCEDNNLTVLDVSAAPDLQTLNCGYNQLTHLNVSNNAKLLRLHCEDNALTTLNLAGCVKLDQLYSGNNRFSGLDVSKNLDLTWLSCQGNRLTTLDVSRNSKLETLYCYENQLSVLDVSANMKLNRILCNDNKLTALNVAANTELLTLDCGANLIASLDTRACAKIKWLYCNDNNILNLQFASGALQTLECHQNYLDKRTASAFMQTVTQLVDTGKSVTYTPQKNDILLTALEAAAAVDRDLYLLSTVAVLDHAAAAGEIVYTGSHDDAVIAAAAQAIYDAIAGLKLKLSIKVNDVTSVKVDDPFTITVTTNTDIKNVIVKNAGGRTITQISTVVTPDPSEGILIWKIELSLGTVGVDRELQIFTQKGSETAVDTGLRGYIDVTAKEPSVISAGFSATSVAVNVPITLTVRTNKYATGISIKNGNSNMGKTLVSKVVESNGEITWTYTMQIGTAGSNRTFQVYAANAEGVVKPDGGFPVSIKVTLL